MALQKANILNPPDQYADFRDQVFSEEHLKELSQRQIFIFGGDGEDLELLQQGVGKGLLDVALAITLARHERGEIRGDEVPKAPNGKVVRDMRKRSDGLLIIYPTMAGRPGETKTPMVGFALSFPRDDLSVPVEYLVNQVYEQLHLFDEEVDV